MRAHAVHSLERRRHLLLAVIVSAHRQHRCPRPRPVIITRTCVTHTSARAAHFAAAQFTADDDDEDQFPTPPEDDNNNINNIIIIWETMTTYTPNAYLSSLWSIII